MKRILSRIIGSRATPRDPPPAPRRFVWRTTAREEDWALHIAESGDLAMWLRDNDTVSSGIARAGGYERAVTAVIRALLRPAGTFIDVGANVGWHTLAAASAYRDFGAGRALAFEAQPSVAAYLARSVAASGLDAHAEVRPIALGDEDGEIGLRAPGRNSGGVHVLPPGMRVGGGETATMRRLDDLGLDTTAIDCIKIDIEGGEPSFLDGAAKLIANARPPIVSEVHPRKLAAIGRTSAAAYVKRVVALGYEARLIEPRGALSPFDPAAIGERAIDVLFLPAGRG